MPCPVPLIIIMTSSGVLVLTSDEPTSFPSLMTIALSHILNISSRRWDMYMVVIPLAFKVPIISKSCSDSSWVREVVGSSIMSTLQSTARALAISTICFSGRDKSPTRPLGSMCPAFSFASCSFVSAYIFLKSMRFPTFLGSWDTYTFSMTFISDIRLNSW